MMSEINELKRRVRTLQRKFARELAEYRLGLICDDLCERWFAAMVQPQALARNPALHQAGDGRRLPASALGRSQQLPAGLSWQR